MENEKQDLEKGEEANNLSQPVDHSKTCQTPQKRFLRLIVLLVLLAPYVIWRWSVYKQDLERPQQQIRANPPKKSTYANLDWHTDPDGLDYHQYDYERVYFTRAVTNEFTSIVACYPGTSGTWFVTDVTPVEFDFLGLDYNDLPQNKSSDQFTEDKFCDRLQLLEPMYVPDNYKAWDHFMQEKLPTNWIGNKFCWPRSGGAWVKKFWLSFPDKAGAYEFYGGERGIGAVAAIKNAATMEERCLAFEKAGAKFCAKLEDCEETEQFIGQNIW
ncbi:hypothetical protein ABW21_db0203208 [Orbilia brochopaga]|nr:hypothetical protein ABW21_db0203208 [Drechslerella brochopaga]